MKKALSNVGAVLMGSLVVIGMFAAVMHATSAEVWYAGEHIKAGDRQLVTKKALTLTVKNCTAKVKASKR
jgi:hypothetical protein